MRIPKELKEDFKKMPKKSEIINLYLQEIMKEHKVNKINAIKLFWFAINSKNVSDEVMSNVLWYLTTVSTKKILLEKCDKPIKLNYVIKQG